MSPARRRASGATVVALLMVAACGGQQPEPTGSPVDSSATRPSDGPDAVDTVLSLASDGVKPLSNVVGYHTGAFAPEQLMVHAALFRLDERLRPVPELAEACEPSSDGLAITCRLRDATFHDGTPVTADDVVFSYEIALSPNCPHGGGFSPPTPLCPIGFIDEVTAVDERTIEIHVPQPNGSLMVETLSNLFITPRAVLEAQFDELVARAADVDTSQAVALADAIGAGVVADPPQCEPHIEAAEAFLATAGVPYEMHRAAPFDVPAWERFDPCNYAPVLESLLRILATIPGQDGTDGLAAAYPLLPFNHAPVGAGVYRVERFEPTEELVLAAFDDYVGGRARIDEIRWRIMDPEAAAAAFRRGEVHVLSHSQVLADPGVLEEPGTNHFETSSNQWVGLIFNVRDGSLFADRNLRHAVALCSDFPRSVSAAAASARPIVSPVVPTVHWAYMEDLPRPERDVEAARELIEAAGWEAAPDGRFTRGGEPLSFPVLVRGDAAERHQFLELLATQLADCGMDLTIVPADFFNDVLPMLATPPHLAPGTDQPFGAYFGGWNINFDPNYFHWLFHSSKIPTGAAGQDGYFNTGGLASPEIDALLDEAGRTYDLNERARIYRDLQVQLAAEAPILFAWNPTDHMAVSDRIISAAGALNTESPRWGWQLEQLVLQPADE